MLKMKILKEKNSQKEETFNSKGPMVLKTRLKNVPISDKLRDWNPQNFSELINQPFQQNNTFSNITIKSFKESLRSNILSNSFFGKTVSRANDPNRTQAGMNILLNLKNRGGVGAPPQGRLLDMTQVHIPRGGGNNKLKEFFEEEQMKILIKENYDKYTVKLKNLYPKFQFNHYYVTRSELIENYYRKYGEEGDINNRNFTNKKKMNEKNKNNKNQINVKNLFSNDNYNFIKIEEEKYKQSNLLDILGVQDNVKVSPSEFKIKKDFMSRTDIVEINMIQNDLSFKMGIINKELDSILQKYGYKIYNYTEKNIKLKTQIEEYLNTMHQKKLIKNEINKKYIDNSAKLIMKGLRQKKLKKILNYLYELKNIKNDVIYLDNILISDDYFEIKDISNKINNLKNRMKEYREKFKIKNRLKLFKNVENRIKSYESKGEEKMFTQFTLNLEKILNICLIYKKEDYENLKKSGNYDINNIQKWNLEKQKETKNNFFFMNEDFELIENQTNKFIKYLLIYNNTNINLITNLLLSILDMYETIIKDGMDMNIITSKYKEILRKIILNNFDLIEKESNNKLVIIYIISNCYTILLSNYFYLIELLQKNFGLNIKIFNEITQVIREEMDKFISIVILAYLHEVMFDHEWSEFLEGLKLAKKYCFMYLSNGYTNLNYENMTNDVYQEYINYFDTNETKKLKDEINELKLEQIKNIESKYQQMFNILYTFRGIETLTPDQIDIKKIYKDKNSNDEINNLKNTEYIIITHNNEDVEENENKETDTQETKDEEDSKHLISELSLLYINYTYQILNIFVSTTNDDLKDNIVNILFKNTKEILMNTNNLIINKSNVLDYKKIALYCSDLTVMENSLCAILDLYENEELQKLFNDIYQSCIDIISHSIGVINSTIINSFNNLDFNKYNIMPENECNNFVKNFTKIYSMYTDIYNCVNKDDLIKIFENVFESLFDEIEKIIKNKGKLNKEEEIIQFKKDFDFIKKYFDNFKEINCDKYLKNIDLIIKQVCDMENKDSVNEDNKVENNEEKK